MALSETDLPRAYYMVGKERVRKMLEMLKAQATLALPVMASIGDWTNSAIGSGSIAQQLVFDAILPIARLIAGISALVQLIIFGIHYRRGQETSMSSFIIPLVVVAACTGLIAMHDFSIFGF